MLRLEEDRCARGVPSHLIAAGKPLPQVRWPVDPFTRWPDHNRFGVTGPERRAISRLRSPPLAGGASEGRLCFRLVVAGRVACPAGRGARHLPDLLHAELPLPLVFPEILLMGRLLHVPNEKTKRA